MEHTAVKKETSIDWLMTQLYKKGFIKEIDGNEPIILMNQAKEMEKQQIIDAFDKGLSNGQENAFYILTREGEKYYNETFKNK
jgi:hypothetical protein